jgi:hypothetical protein
MDAASLIGELKPKGAGGEQYLGPACVLSAEGQEVMIELPTGETRAARLALAFLYQPVPGDVLLVIGKEEYYGIGVLHGTGKASLSFHGDVDLRAVGGALRLSGDRGVSVEGPEVEIHAGRLKTIADAVVEKCNSLYQRVSSLLSVHAGKSHTIVDGLSFTQAESGAIVTREVMTINGKQVHLG